MRRKVPASGRRSAMLDRLLHHGHVLKCGPRGPTSGLGRWRWVVERSFAWLNQFRRLRVRYEKRADIHEAFLFLGCALICWRFLRVDRVTG